MKTNVLLLLASSNVEVLDMITNESSLVLAQPPSVDNQNSEWATSSEETELLVTSLTTSPSSSTSTPSTLDTTEAALLGDNSEAVTLIPWELIQKGGHFEKISLPKVRAQKIQKFPVYRQDQVRVVIHNITQITEKELEKGRSLGSAAMDDDINEKM